MAKTFASVQKEIAALQAQAEKLKLAEAGEVISRIKAAIAQYGLTQADLFGGLRRRGRPPSKSSKPSEGGARSASRKAKGSGKVKPKYRDEAGNVWSGRGSQPRWLREHVQAGKKVEDFLV